MYDAANAQVDEIIITVDCTNKVTTEKERRHDSNVKVEILPGSITIKMQGKIYALIGNREDGVHC